MAYRLSEMPETSTISLDPLAVVTLAAIRAGISACSARASLPVFTFHSRVMSFTLLVVRMCSSFCHAERWLSLPSVSHSAFCAAPTPQHNASIRQTNRFITTLSLDAAPSALERNTVGVERTIVGRKVNLRVSYG